MARILVVIAPFIVGLLSACGGGGGNDDGAGGTGQLSLAVTDGPVENADALYVSFNGVELKGPERILIEFDEIKTINLLDYQGEDSFRLLANEQLPAGDYQWIRLGVLEGLAYTYMEMGGQSYELAIPSGAQTGLKLNRGFTLGVGSVVDFTIDFDLRKSVHEDAKGYKLRPTLRIVDNLEVGTITGTVAEELIASDSCHNGDDNDEGNAVYLYSGADATVQDLQGNALDPLTTATVSYRDDINLWAFKIGFVPTGEYSLAFTCDAALDMPDGDDSAAMVFSDGVNVTVTSGENSSVDISSSALPGPG